MSIGTTIKKLRRERNITQEQLAEYLGVSANSVSQWECDKTAPDISHLPILAGIFEVSADILLEIDIVKSKKQAEIKRFTEENALLHSKGKTDERLKLCREMQKKYPNDETVMFYLMRALQNGYAKENFDEIIMLGETLLSSQNAEYKLGAIRALCFSWKENGDEGNALRYAKMLPEYDDLLVHILKGEELTEHCQKFFYNICDKMYVELSYLLDRKDAPYTAKEKYQMRKSLYNIFHIIFSDGDFGYWEDRLGRLCFFMACDSMELGENEQALVELEKMLSHFEKAQSFDKIRHTSPLVNTLTVSKEDCKKHSEETLAHQYYRYINNKQNLFAAISKDPRFVSVLESLSKL
ncbi:MAG: helix-turn-helix transcriptional regulator [Ruminococcaceae bacterium]|nr:helix-turn-helix transcriptional regulator [Oscillospiraceae bacterium]